jgi:DNA-directed RNA polymerase specialized sigma24 family protein
VDDLTQCFIEYLLEGNRLKNVEPRETKFRTYLIECIRRLVRGEWRKAMAAKRGSGLAPVELDETAVGLTVDLDRHVDQDFALAVHQRALDRLATGRFSGEPKRTRFHHLQPFILGYDPEISYAEIGSRLGMCANHVKKAVFDLRLEYYVVRVVDSGSGWRLVQNSNQVVVAEEFGVRATARHWTKTEADHRWSNVASSDDGTRLTAVAFGIRDRGGQIWVSTNAGLNWGAVGPRRYWTSCAIDSISGQAIAQSLTDA